MKPLDEFNAPQLHRPGMGDDVPCEKCGAIALDTGLECSECGHDNWEAVTGQPYRANQPLVAVLTADKDQEDDQ